MRNIYFQPGLSETDLEGIHRVSPSFLKTFKRSPAHAYTAYLDPNRVESDSEALRIGRILHCAILEPERFITAYAVKITVENLANELRANLAVGSEDLRAMIDNYNGSKPTKLSMSGSVAELKQRVLDAQSNLPPGLAALDPGTIDVMKGPELKLALEDINKGRIDPLPKSGTINEMRDRLLEAGVPVVLFSELVELQRRECEAKGVEIIKQEDLDLARTLRDKIRAKQASQILLDQPNCEYEVELVFRCPLTGLVLQCRIDYLIKPCEQYPNGLIADPKFVESAQIDAFRAAVRRYDYFIQAAWNATAVQAVFGTEQRPPFIWLAAEKEAPFASQYYIAAEGQIALGDHWMNRLLPVVAKCISTGVWNEYNEWLEPFEHLDPHPADLRVLDTANEWQKGKEGF
ncbi:exodeoxyribonuclease VIII [Pararheinheimera phage vB_PsoM_KLER1-1]|nr:exodeoxyribonuclease VIII [Pararheinheimera phage vB_PsoM_KLER1-1]